MWYVANASPCVLGRGTRIPTVNPSPVASRSELDCRNVEQGHNKAQTPLRTRHECAPWRPGLLAFLTRHYDVTQELRGK